MYREIVPKEHIEIFRKAIDKTILDVDSSKIGYIGLIGSSLDDKYKSAHDIDVLIYPSLGAKIGEALIEMYKFYNSLNERLEKDHKLFLATCPRKVYQAEVNYIVGTEKGFDKKISTHTLFFPDHESFISLNPVDFSKSVKKNFETLLGDSDIIKKRESIDQKILEQYFLIADYQISTIHKSYPEILVLQKTEELLDYFRKRYDIDHLEVPRTIKDCVIHIDDLLRTLDRSVA